jgi:thiosulfate/3-mercaptopyruvate sulfurtransferase
MTEPALQSLVDADTLRANLNDASWRVIDCRHDLLHPESGAQAYAQGHIAGAVFAHLDHDLSGPKTGRNGRHPLPDPDQLVGRLRRWGIDPNTQIVVYDANGGQFAGRLWWLARWLGHDRVALLDGGWQAALKAGLTIEARPAEPPPGRFERGPALSHAVDLGAIHGARTDPGWLMVDARSPDRYAGANETIDPVAGHIPGAVNRFWQANLGPDGLFKSPAQLRSEFSALLAGRDAAHLIAQCGSGVTACHHLVAMQRAGLVGGRLFPGSWSEWISESSRPIAVGQAP